MYYNYHRDYDPSLGRYIQSDPIGLSGGLNTYGYVGANPLMGVDPLGLSQCGCGVQGDESLETGVGSLSSDVIQEPLTVEQANQINANRESMSEMIGIAHEINVNIAVGLITYATGVGPMTSLVASGAVSPMVARWLDSQRPTGNRRPASAGDTIVHITNTHGGHSTVWEYSYNNESGEGVYNRRIATKRCYVD